MKHSIYTNCKFFKQWQAFSLSEILVTMSVIGVVAAITIPGLMNNIQDKQFKEAAKKAYSQASQAIKQMQQDNGGNIDSLIIDGAATFKNAFMPYFQVIKDCGNTNCVSFTDFPNIYKAIGKTPFPDGNWARWGQFVTTDGMFWFFEGGPQFCVDVNGYQKGPNVYGIDTFVFEYISGKGILLPEGADGTASASYRGSACSRTAPNPATDGVSCIYYVMMGINY